MAISFPQNPVLNQVYSYGERSWKWNGLAWRAVGSGGLEVVTNNVSINGVPYGRGDASDNSSIAIGISAMTQVPSGTYNIAIGTNSFVGGAGTGNTAVGSWSFYNNFSTGGNNNVALGYHATSPSLSAGDNNVFIGAYSGHTSSAVTLNNKLFIESSPSGANGRTLPLIGGDFSARTVHVDGTLTASAINIDGGTP